MSANHRRQRRRIRQLPDPPRTAHSATGRDDRTAEPDVGQMEADTRRNVLAYYLNFSVVALVGLAVNPLLLGALGPLLFGAWKSLQRYLDFATVADGRASQALKWIVASRTTLSQEEKQRDVGAAIIVWFRWLPATMLVATAVTVAIPLLIKGMPEDTRSNVYAAAAILAANTVLAGLLSLPDAVLTGTNQGYKSMLVTTIAFIISNIAMLVAAFAGWPLWSLAAIVLGAAVLNAIITLLVARRAVSWWGVLRPSPLDLRRVFGYSAWTLGWVGVEKLFLSGELIVISVMIGAAAVTQYTFTAYVMQFILTIALVTASGFMPALGSQLGALELGAAAAGARSVRHLVLGITVIGSAAVLSFNGIFVTLWVGPQQYLGTSVNALLVVCGLQLALIRMDGQILDVTMRIGPKVLMGIVSSAGGIAAGCVSYALSQNLAIALLATIVLRSASNLAYPVFVSKSIPGSGLPWQPVVLGGSLLIVSFATGPLAQHAKPFTLIGLVAGWTVLTALAAWFGLVPRSLVRGLLRR